MGTCSPANPATSPAMKSVRRFAASQAAHDVVGKAVHASGPPLQSRSMEAPPPPPTMRTAGAVLTRPTVTVATTVAAIATLMALGSLTLEGNLAPAVGHGISHAFAAIPVAVLAYAALRRWPPARRTPPGRLARLVAVVGIVGILVGQVLEILGARVDDPRATAVEGAFHTAGQIITMLALVAAVMGGVLALIAAAREGAVPRWVAVFVSVVVAGALVFVAVGAPGG